MGEDGGSATAGATRRLRERFRRVTGARSDVEVEGSGKTPHHMGSLLSLADHPALRRLAWMAALTVIFVAAFAWRWHFASQTKIYTYDSYFYMVLGRNLRHGFHYNFIAGHPHFKFMPLYPMSIAFLSLFSNNLEFVDRKSVV